MRPLFAYAWDGFMWAGEILWSQKGVQRLLDEKV